jgi:hypothetical protein
MMMSTAPPPPSNRFELLPDNTDDEVAQVPVPHMGEEEELPPLTQPKSNALCYVTAGMFTRLGLCQLPYDKALVSRVLSISHDK